MTHSKIPISTLKLLSVFLFSLSGNAQECGFFTDSVNALSGDRQLQIENWTGVLLPGDPNANRQFTDGDCDADMDIDTIDVVRAWKNASDHVEGGPGVNFLDYDSRTGELSIDASENEDGGLVAFVITTPETFRKDSVLVPYLDTGRNTDIADSQIGQVDFFLQGAGPIISLGTVAPIGLTPDEFEDFIGVAEFVRNLGQGGELTLRVLEVPESSTGGSMIIALIGIASVFRPMHL